MIEIKREETFSYWDKEQEQKTVLGAGMQYDGKVMWGVCVCELFEEVLELQ